MIPPGLVGGGALVAVESSVEYFTIAYNVSKTLQRKKTKNISKIWTSACEQNAEHIPPLPLSGIGQTPVAAQAAHNGSGEGLKDVGSKAPMNSTHMAMLIGSEHSLDPNSSTIISRKAFRHLTF